MPLENNDYQIKELYPIQQDLLANQLSITAKTAGGKTTLIKALKKHLGEDKFTFISAGKFMRTKAVELGFCHLDGSADIEAFAKFNMEHPESGYDKWCDDQVKRASQNDFVIGEGRLTHLFMPYAFKVLLTCDVQIRARRRANDNSESFIRTLTNILTRDFHDEERYELLYPGCIWSKDKFDLAIDTGYVSRHRTLEIILAKHAEWQRQHFSSTKPALHIRSTRHRSSMSPKFALQMMHTG